MQTPKEPEKSPSIAHDGDAAMRLAGMNWVDRIKMHDQLFMLGTAIVIGVLCGYSAVGLRYLIDFFHHLSWGEVEASLSHLREHRWMRILLVPALGGVAVGPLIYYFAREAKGHGVPEVMAAVALRNGMIRARVAVAKAVASALTIASGGSAGREGPVIQIGAAIGSVVGQTLKISRRRLKTFVGCGAAAGIAATFNAPIAGALFSVEVILGEFGVAQFSPIVISSVMATVVARHYFGDAPVFMVPKYELAHFLELIPYMGLGLLCGLVATCFIRVLYFAEDRFDGMHRVPEPLRPMLGGLMLGIIGLALPHVYGDGYESINLALTNQLSWGLLCMLLVAKILATSFTLGSGGSGGVFAPSLFLGAMTGGLVGKISSTFFGASVGAAGGYALVGMGGVVAGATFAPISAILIIFEITYDYNIILPLMTVCIVSTVVATKLSGDSIYTLKLRRRGIDISHGRSMDVLKSLSVSACTRNDPECMSPDVPVKDMINRMFESDKTRFYMVDRETKFLGVIELRNLNRVLMHREGLEQVLLAEDIANEGGPVCTPDESLSQALLKFENSGMSELPVVRALDDQELIGTLEYADVIALYNSEVIRIDMAGSLVSRVGFADGGRPTKVVDGISMAEWAPPAALYGKTLAEAQLPSRFGVRIVLLKKQIEGASGSAIAPTLPGGDYVISESDTFLLCGTDENLSRIREYQG